MTGGSDWAGKYYPGVFGGSGLELCAEFSIWSYVESYLENHYFSSEDERRKQSSSLLRCATAWGLETTYDVFYQYRIAGLNTETQKWHERYCRFVAKLLQNGADPSEPARRRLSSGYMTAWEGLTGMLVTAILGVDNSVPPDELVPIETMCRPYFTELIDLCVKKGVNIEANFTHIVPLHLDGKANACSLILNIEAHASFVLDPGRFLKDCEALMDQQPIKIIKLRRVINDSNVGYHVPVTQEGSKHMLDLLLPYWLRRCGGIDARSVSPSDIVKRVWDVSKSSRVPSSFNPPLALDASERNGKPVRKWKWVRFWGVNDKLDSSEEAKDFRESVSSEEEHCLYDEYFFYGSPCDCDVSGREAPWIRDVQGST